MEKRDINDVLRRNVALLSKIGEKEASMMPAIEAPLPSVEQVKQIVTLVKSIIFPDYFNKRQPDEAIRSYYIGVHMEELMTLLTKQIAHGLQFCEDCKEIHTKAQVYAEAERLATQFVDTLPEIKRLLYTDVEAMFDADPAATNYGEVIFCYPVMNTMTHYRIAHRLHELKVPVIPRIITELAHSKTGIDIHPGAQIGEYFAIDHGTGVVIGETSYWRNLHHRQPCDTLSGRHPRSQEFQVRRAGEHAEYPATSDYRRQCHRLLQCLYPWPYHYRPSFCDWW